MFPAPGTYGLTSDFSDGRNHGHGILQQAAAVVTQLLLQSLVQ
ncbi:MAG: hypothetical protein ACLSCV_08345 [Acutalibacteraceae bacterium]